MRSYGRVGCQGCKTPKGDSQSPPLDSDIQRDPMDLAPLPSLGPSPFSGMRFKLVWSYKGHSSKHSGKMTNNDEIPAPVETVPYPEVVIPPTTVN